MQPEPPILDDGKEPSEPDAPCQATEDEDFYFHFVTFQVKGTSQKQSRRIFWHYDTHPGRRSPIPRPKQAIL